MHIYVLRYIKKPVINLLAKFKTKYHMYLQVGCFLLPLNLIPDYIFFTHKTAIPKKIKINSFIPFRHPFPSLFFPSPSLPQNNFEMVRLCSLSYSDFFYSLPCFFVYYSVIYHCTVSSLLPI
jgi:hypothetical protein